MKHRVKFDEVCVCVSVCVTVLLFVSQCVCLSVSLCYIHMYFVVGIILNVQCYLLFKVGIAHYETS